MDNIREENLKRLGQYIADALIDNALHTSREDWIETDIKDHTIGELARCVTLQNLYLDREEFEKCAIMKVRIMELSDRLGLELDPNLTNLEEEEDEDEI